MRRVLVVGLAAAVSTALLLGPAASASAVTLGANVNDTSNTVNSGCNPACTAQPTNDVPAQTMQATCAGIVTTWRVNATASATFSLHVIRDNGDGTFTSTATSAAGITAGAGIAVFSTSLPITVGEYIGVDLPPAPVILSRTTPGVRGNVFRPPMVDGTPESPNIFNAPETALVNADVTCGGGPTGTTGERAAALKRCKKRAHKHHWSHKRLKGCKKDANRLPV